MRRHLLRILVVDDNRDGADSLSMLLKLMGNKIRTAYDGEAGGGGGRWSSSLKWSCSTSACPN